MSSSDHTEPNAFFLEFLSTIVMLGLAIIFSVLVYVTAYDSPDPLDRKIEPSESVKAHQ